MNWFIIAIWNESSVRIANDDNDNNDSDDKLSLKAATVIAKAHDTTTAYYDGSLTSYQDI